MISIIGIISCIFIFSLWMWYELKHPMDAKDEYDEAVEFREKSNKIETV